MALGLDDIIKEVFQAFGLHCQNYTHFYTLTQLFHLEDLTYLPNTQLPIFSKTSVTIQRSYIFQHRTLKKPILPTFGVAAAHVEIKL